MRPLFVAVITAALLPSAAFAEDLVSIAATAVDARDTCVSEAVIKAKAKKVSADTLKLILEGACTEKAVVARKAYFDALDAATPPGLTIDPGPTNMRFMRRFDNEYDAMKAKAISDYALDQ